MSPENSDPNRAYFEFHNRKLTGKSFEEVVALRPSFYSMIHRKKVTPLYNGPVYSYGGPEEDFYSKGKKRYVFGICLNEEPTEELLKTWKLHKSFRRIPILYSVRHR